MVCNSAVLYMIYSKGVITPQIVESFYLISHNKRYISRFKSVLV